MSQASDIALPQIVFMSGIMNNMVYDWAAVLADRMEEFMTLQHRTFFMPHHAIGLFLEAAANQLPLENFDAPPREKLANGEPPIFYWRHLDTGGQQLVRRKYFEDSRLLETQIADERTLQRVTGPSPWKRTRALLRKLAVMQRVVGPHSLPLLSCQLRRT